MNRCSHCKIVIYDERRTCPFCHSVLQDIPEQEEAELSAAFGEPSPYPDLVKKSREVRFFMKMLLLAMILVEIVLIYINYFITPGLLWSVLTGVNLLYLYLFLYYWIYKDSGFAYKIGNQLILTMILTFFIDYFTGMHNWALPWAIPGLILVGDGLAFALMVINRSRWTSYLLFLMMMLVCCIVLLALVLFGVIQNGILVGITFVITGFYLLAVLVFGERSFKREMKRRFHV
ncbi:MAG: hypothetical protein J5825_08210 [Lachnospiraceae bacterium]|nr:hypothetical protein [Lachnospiraceae bacterium]